MTATANHDISERLAMTASRRDDVEVVSIGGELDLWTAPTLCARLEERFGSPLLVDLSELAFCDSTGLRALAGAAQEARARCTPLLIVPPARVGAARAFEIAGAAEFLPVVDDPKDALAQLVDGLRR